MKIIGIVSQKGGVGKTTIAMALSSYLAYKLGKRVIVADMDEDQLSIARQRKEEEMIVASPHGQFLQEVIDAHGHPLYPILAIDSDVDLQNTLSPYLEDDSQYDYMIIDTKGAISDRLLLALSIMDHVIIPVNPTATSARSTGTMAEFIQKQLDNKSLDLEYDIIWTNYKPTSVIEEEKEAYKESYFPTSKGHFCDFTIPNRVNIPRRNITNTLFFPIESEMIKSAPELLNALNIFHQKIK